MKVYYWHRCPITIICRKSEVSAFFKFGKPIFIIEKRFFAYSNVIYGVNIIVILQIRSVTLREAKFQDKFFVKGYWLNITKPCVVKSWLVFFTMITYLLLGYRFYFAWRSVNENPVSYHKLVSACHLIVPSICMRLSSVKRQTRQFLQS